MICDGVRAKGMMIDNGGCVRVDSGRCCCLLLPAFSRLVFLLLLLLSLSSFFALHGIGKGVILHWLVSSGFKLGYRIVVNTCVWFDIQCS